MLVLKAELPIRASFQSGNTEALKGEVRRTFRANMNETDPEKIHTMKEAAFR